MKADSIVIIKLLSFALGCFVLVQAVESKTDQLVNTLVLPFHFLRGVPYCRPQMDKHHEAEPMHFTGIAKEHKKLVFEQVMDTFNVVTERMKEVTPSSFEIH